MNQHIVTLNLDTLVAAMEARPATKARAKAWEYLAEVSSVTFEGDALIVPSATWSNTQYLATPTGCTCPARKPCHHMEAAQIVVAARAEDARYDLAADNATWQAAYDAADTPYHAIAHHQATEAVRAARAARTPSAGYTSALADLLECF